jgi:hypothetical protein
MNMNTFGTFKVILKGADGVKEFFTNCANDFFARMIAQGIYDKMEVIGVEKIEE